MTLSIDNTGNAVELMHIFAGANYYYLMKQYQTWKYKFSENSLQENFVTARDSMSETQWIEILIVFVLFLGWLYAYYQMIIHFQKQTMWIIVHSAIATFIAFLDYGMILSILYLVAVKNTKTPKRASFIKN